MTVRHDHWLVGTQLSASGAAFCNKTCVTACGAPWGPGRPGWHIAYNLVPDGYWYPQFARCPECRASKIYQETITAIEVGFDGNEEAWLHARMEELRKA